MNWFLTNQWMRLRAESFRYGRWQLVRWVVLFAVVMTTIAGSWTFVNLLRADGIGLLDVPLILLFVVLFSWIALSFWMVTAGFAYCVAYGRTPHVSPLDPTADQLPRTAVVMPIHNEDSRRVFAGLRTTFESLATTDYGDRFDWFVLSDTTDPGIAVREEMAWAELVETLKHPGNVFYRRRARNVGRKSGNIQDFCQRWGGNYVYMIVLDADSLMIGPTLVQMVRRMEQHPDAGVLQVPPTPVCHRSFFARLQQFSGAVYGELFSTGLALVTGLDGNYYGHNAILRLRPFMAHCGLPKLPGRPPLGGEIFSHDFVEAALIRRAGWRVLIAHDLTGSYEESPTTVLDYSQRDQRWCQGNLQHLHVLFRHGLHPFSRLHLGIGVMAYLSSSLWLLMLMIGVAIAVIPQLGQTQAPDPGAHTAWVLQGVGLFTFTLVLLLAPKLWGYALTRCRPGRMMLQRGDDAVLLSVLIETITSIFLAPIFMCFHVAFVAAAFTGHRVQWTAQHRDEQSHTLSTAVHTCRWHTISGLAAATLLHWFTPTMFWWLAPIWGPLSVSIPLTYLLNSVAVGQWLLRHDLLVIPEETAPPRLIQRLNRYLNLPSATDAAVDPVHRMLVDPNWLTRHIAILDATGMPDPHNSSVQPIIQRIISDPSYQPPAESLRDLLLSRTMLRQLHRDIWTRWPLSDLKRMMTDANASRSSTG